jgi:cyanophycinase-like exopeptidase
MKVRLLRALRLGLLALLPCSAACQKSAAVAPTLLPAVAQPVPGSLGTTGDTADVAGANGQPGLLLMGGSTDVDAAMRWLLRRSGGDVLVLRASGSTGYNDYLYQLTPAVNSVETLLLNSDALARDPRVARRIRQAEAVFIAGGDQANYVNYWRGTPVQEALNYLITQKRVPVGGTSAGCAVLGELMFDARQGTVTSAQALRNPYDPKVSLSGGFLQTAPWLAGVVTDTHYDNPDRRGRHLAFLARLRQDGTVAQPRGIGVEERTAVAIDEQGQATVFGSGQAYFLVPGPQNPEVCASGQPLTWDRNGQGVRVYVLRAGPSHGFSLRDWTTATGGTWKNFVARNGSFSAN